MLVATFTERAAAEVALTGAVLFAATTAFAPVTMALYERMVRGMDPCPPTWKLRHALCTLLILVVALALVGSLPMQSRGEIFRSIAWSGVATVSLGCAILISARRGGLRAWAALGLARRGNLRAVGAALVAYALVLPGIDGLNLLTPWLWQRLGQSLSEGPLLAFLSASDPSQLVALILLFVLVLSFFEEVLFRGYLQPVLVERLGAMQGIAASAFFFACLHPDSCLPIFAFALLLGGVRHHSQSLWASYGVHALHNSLQLAALLSSKGLAALWVL